MLQLALSCKKPAWQRLSKHYYIKLSRPSAALADRHFSLLDSRLHLVLWVHCFALDAVARCDRPMSTDQLLFVDVHLLLQPVHVLSVNLVQQLLILEQLEKLMRFGGLPFLKAELAYVAVERFGIFFEVSNSEKDFWRGEAVLFSYLSVHPRLR